jgi:hypothetical protein
METLFGTTQLLLMYIQHASSHPGYYQGVRFSTSGGTKFYIRLYQNYFAHYYGNSVKWVRNVV